MQEKKSDQAILPDDSGTNYLSFFVVDLIFSFSKNLSFDRTPCKGFYQSIFEPKD